MDWKMPFGPPWRIFWWTEKKGPRPKINGECIMAPPWRDFWWTEIEGAGRHAGVWISPGRSPCELHMVRGFVRVRIRRCAMCATRGTSGFFHKNFNKNGSKDQWRVLILPAVMAGFGTGRYTMCDLDLSRLRDYPGQDTAYSLRIIT